MTVRLSVRQLALLFSALAWEQVGGDDGVAAAEALLDRLLPGVKGHFRLSLASACPGPIGAPCYGLSDEGQQLRVVASGTSELTAALGFYFREYCNWTIGWPRGGGTNLQVPSPWPRVGTQVVRRRSVPWSYMMNVCTHSYSLVWYDWSMWENLIDWMALSGVNNVLALTGQEELQYKVFRSLGLNDTEIRGWFNGPAFLTWSRGQNEYGAGIAGPLPRSWMKAQWRLQRQILQRYRELGIVGQLPGFQGNVPIGLKALRRDANITTAGATGWVDALDPLFGEVGDVWMRMLLEDFGTDHWYQLDGYFNGGTAPWRGSSRSSSLVGEAVGDVAPDPVWMARGAAVYRSLNRTDPKAIWSYQGFAVEQWKETAETASWFKGFVSAVPAGRFSILDMGTAYSRPEWQRWGGAAFFGAKFIWTALNNFGGTDGLKGNISRTNEMPFAALEAGTAIWGTGFTPEGIDQNPAYYEFLLDQPWRTSRVPDVAFWLSSRAHRRYGLTALVPEVDRSWRLLAGSMYSNDVTVQDATGVAHLPGTATWDFRTDGHTPGPDLCATYAAWLQLLNAAGKVPAYSEPFRYDLVNLGRDVLARLSTVTSRNLSNAVTPHGGAPPVAQEVAQAGHAHAELLGDLDTLVATDTAFLLGPWLTAARSHGGNSSDCTVVGEPTIATCEDFYEWNARVQLTTWNPTPKGAAQVPGGPVDYAAKHWSGLIRDYYRERSVRLTDLALASAAAGNPLEQAAVDQMEAELAHEWSTSFSVRYPQHPSGDAVTVSQEMVRKYSPRFAACPGVSERGVIVV